MKLNGVRKVGRFSRRTDLSRQSIRTRYAGREAGYLGIHAMNLANLMD